METKSICPEDVPSELSWLHACQCKLVVAACSSPKAQSQIKLLASSCLTGLLDAGDNAASSDQLLPSTDAPRTSDRCRYSWAAFSTNSSCTNGRPIGHFRPTSVALILAATLSPRLAGSERRLRRACWHRHTSLRIGTPGGGRVA